MPDATCTIYMLRMPDTNEQQTTARALPRWAMQESRDIQQRRLRQPHHWTGMQGGVQGRGGGGGR